MIVNTPDGQVNFPDSMSDDDVQNVLRQKYGFKGAAPAPGSGAPAAPGAQTPTSPSADDSMLTRLAKWAVGVGDPQTVLQPRSLSQAGSDVADFGRLAANTFGFGDRALAHLSAYGLMPTLFPGLASLGEGDKISPGAGPGNDLQTNLAAEHARTAAASERLGPVASAAANMVGYGPLGSLGIAGRLGGGVLGMAGEGAAAGAAGAAGNGDSPGAGLLEGALAGFGGGVAGKALGALARPVMRGVNAIGRQIGALSTPEQVLAEAAADTSAAYGKLTRNYDVSGSDIENAVTQKLADIAKLDPGGLNMQYRAPGTMQAANSILDWARAPATKTAEDIANLQKSLVGIQRAGKMAGNADAAYAPMLKDALDTALGNATPKPGVTQPATDALKAAKQAFQREANADDLLQMQQSLKGFGTSPAGRAQDIAESYYNNPQSPEYQALSRIAMAAGGGHGPSPWGLMHAAYPMMDAAAAASGIPPHLGAALSGGVAYGFGKPAMAGVIKKGQQRSVMDAINQGYPALAGAPVAWQVPPGVGDALRTLMMSRIAAQQ